MCSHSGSGRSYNRIVYHPSDSSFDILRKAKSEFHEPIPDECVVDYLIRKDEEIANEYLETMRNKDSSKEPFEPLDAKRAGFIRSRTVKAFRSSEATMLKDPSEKVSTGAGKIDSLKTKIKFLKGENKRIGSQAARLFAAVGRSNIIAVVLLMLISAIIGRATAESYEISGMCCDYDGDLKSSLILCNTTGLKQLTPLIEEMESIGSPWSMNDMWVENLSGSENCNFVFECSVMAQVNKSECKTWCGDNSTSADHCSGDVHYCANMPCSPSPQCWCRSSKGHLIKEGRLTYKSLKQEVINLNCSYSYQLTSQMLSHSLRRVGRKPLENSDHNEDGDNNVIEEFFLDIDEDQMILIYPNNETRTITFMCKEKTHVIQCKERRCSVKVSEVCIQNEKILITSYESSGSVTHSSMCPVVTVNSFECKRSPYWFDVNNYRQWNCLENWEKLFIVAAIIYFLSVTVFLIWKFAWICYPVWFTMSVIKTGASKAYNIRKTRIYKRASDMTRNRLYVIGKNFEEEDVESPPVSRKERREIIVDDSDSNEEMVQIPLSQAKNYVKSYKYRSPKTLNTIPAVFACLILFTFLNNYALAIPYSEDCSDTDILVGSQYVSCVVTLDKKECSISMSIAAFLPYPGAVQCYDFQSDSSTIMKVYVEYYNHTTSASKRDLYYSSNWDPLSASSKRCDQAGKCSSGHCSGMLSGDATADGELTGETTEYPGLTRCDASCGCAGCGCFYCSDGCLYSRAALKPKEPFYKVEEVIAISQYPLLLVTTVSGSTLIDQIFVGGIGSASSANYTYNILGNFAGSVSVFGTNKVVKIDNSTDAHLISASDSGSPSTQSIGDIQANSLNLLKNKGVSNFNYASSMWSAHAGQDSTSYTFEPSGASKIPLGKKFPVTIDGQVWQYSPTALINLNTNPGTLSYTIKSKKPFNVTQTVTAVCPQIEAAGSAGGCYSCLSSSFFNLTAKSICSSGFATVILKDDEFDGVNSPNLITTSLPLVKTDKEYKIYFRNSKPSLAVEICLVGQGKTSCKTFVGDFPADINVGNNTRTDTNNKEDGSGSGGIVESILEFFNNIGDFVSNNKSRIFQALIAIGVIFTVFLIAYLVIRAVGVEKVEKYISNITRKFRKSKLKKEDDEIDSLLAKSEPKPVLQSDRLRDRKTSSRTAN